MTLEEQFDSLDAAIIQAFVENGQQEHVQLEFKVLKSSSFKSGDDKRNLAKTLSAFANSLGGIIIWGVDARVVDGVDQAVKSELIENLPEAFGRINSLEGEAMQPRLSGIKHRKIHVDGDRGYLITLVPESDTAPHMAKCGYNCYFKRNGDSSIVMEHFDLADMFGRRPQPKLSIQCDFNSGHDRQSRILTLVNEGRGAATAPIVQFALPHEMDVDSTGLDGNGNQGLPRIPTSYTLAEVAFGGSSDIVIPANFRRDIVLIRFSNVPSEIELSYRVSCAETPVIRGTVVIPKD